jgi:hypothetical protein
MEKINSTTYKKEVKNNPKDRIEVIVGDDKQLDFKPQVKIQRWDNEVNFSIRAEEKPNATVEQKKGVIKYITTDYEVHQYEKPEVSEDGGFEFEWVLNKKPESNILKATIQTKGLDFFYQPEPTQEEINDGLLRPDNVIGSYAVYHKTKKDNIVGDMEYKTGKFCHIYRPKAIDKNGVETWCELNINEEAGELTVTVPQEFLDNAVYPIIVDPTFGYTTLGASRLAIGGEDPDISEVYAIQRGKNTIVFTVDGTLDSLTAGLSADASSQVTDFYIAMYREDSGGSGTHELVVGIERVDLAVTTSNAWYTFNAASESIIADTYIASSVGNGSKVSTDVAVYIALDTVSSGKLYQESATGSSSYSTRKSENPWVQSSFSTSTANHFSIYATYTVPSSFTSSPMMFMMAQSGGLM